MVKQVSFGQPSFMQDLQTLPVEAQRLREALAKLQEDRNPNPVQAGRSLAVNLAPLGDMLQRGRLKSALEKNQSRMGEAQGQYSEAAAKALAEFEQSGPQDNDRFLGSPFPEVSGRAKARGERLAEALKKLLEKGSTESLKNYMGTGDPSQLQAPDKYSFEGGAIVKMPEGRMPEVVSPVTQVPLPGGKPGQVANRAVTGGLQGVGSGGTEVTTNVNPSDRRAEALLLDQLPKEQEKAEVAKKAFAGAQQGLQALAEGARSGVGADFLQNAATLVQTLTGVQFQGTPSFGVLASALGQSTIQELGGLGVGVSQADLEFMRTAAGSTSTDPKALERILAIRLGGNLRYLERVYPERMASSSQGAGNPQIQAQLQDRFKVDVPALGIQFKSPEAEASFLATYQNIDYPTALRAVNQRRQQMERSPAGAPGQPPVSLKQQADEIARKYLQPGAPR